MLARGGASQAGLDPELRARGFQRQFVEAAGLRVERGIDACHFLVVQHVGGAPLDRGHTLVIGGLEGIEGAHQFGMGDMRFLPGVRRKTGLDFEAGGFEVVVSEVH